MDKGIVILTVYNNIYAKGTPSLSVSWRTEQIFPLHNTTASGCLTILPAVIFPDLPSAASH